MQGLCVFCLFCFACSPNPVLFLHDNVAGFALGNDLADILTLSLSILLPFLVLKLNFYSLKRNNHIQSLQFSTPYVIL